MVWKKLADGLRVWFFSIRPGSKCFDGWLRMKVSDHPVLRDLEPRFAEKVLALLTMASAAGMQVDAHMGMRTWEKQEAIYAQGRTRPGKIVTNAKPGFSWHNYGLAVDVVFKKGGAWSWSEEHPWAKLGALGKQCGLEWGGDWKTSKDRPHFQFTGGLSIRDALRAYITRKLESVWEKVYASAV